MPELLMLSKYAINSLELGAANLRFGLPLLGLCEIEGDRERICEADQ